MSSSNPHITPRDVPSTRKVFVGGLSLETTVDDLRQYFEHFGQVEDVTVMNKSGAKRGFGFVTFYHPTHADLVVAQRHHSIRNCTVECKVAMVPKQSTARGYFPTFADAWVGYNAFCTQQYEQYGYLPQMGPSTMVGYQPHSVLLMPVVPVGLFPQANTMSPQPISRTASLHLPTGTGSSIPSASLNCRFFTQSVQCSRPFDPAPLRG